MIWHGESLELTPTEFELLARLVAKPGCLITASDLLALIWGETMDSGKARQLLKPHISNLRAKLKKAADAPNPIQNVWGTGYLWNEGSELGPTLSEDD